MTIIGMGNGSPKGPAATADVAFVTERDFEALVLRSELPVLLMFSSERSAASKQVLAEVSALAGELSGKLSVLRVDVDRSPTIARQLRVQQVPTFMVWVEGQPIDAQVGPLGKKQLAAMVEPHLPRAEGALKAIELRQLITAGKVVAVDTRDKPSYDRAHLPGAKQMALEEIEGRIAELMMLGTLPVLYCRAGDRSKEVALRLGQQEIPCAFLEGGLLAWEAEGYPIERT